MTTPVELVVDCLAAYRLTRLITADTITLRPRAALIRRSYLAGGGIVVMAGGKDIDSDRDWYEHALDDENPPKLAKLVTCRWCMGFWVSVLVVAARTVAPRTWQRVGVVLSASATAALVATLEDD